jgi:hypothetical protein
VSKEEGVNRDYKRVLVVANQQGETSHLREQLARHGCRCSFATSAEEILRLLDNHTFDLILSTVWLRDGVVKKLVDSHATAFFAHPLRNGCWWLPVLDHGQHCLGAPALRPKEFGALVSEILVEARPARRLTA